jgi:putative colanic acid biosynthesis acetyltransferase WcaF
MKTSLSLYNNDWYQPGSRLKRLIWYFVNVVLLQNALNPSSGLKIAVLRLFGAKIGKGVVIKPKVNIKYPWLLSIGDYCWIGEQVWIDNLAQVTLEDHVCISQGALLQCGNHNYKKISFDLMISPIVLKEGSWVGARSNVAPGVTLGSHAILSFGSTATKDLEAYTIYAGHPAKAVKKRVIESFKTT